MATRRLLAISVVVLASTAVAGAQSFFKNQPPRLELAATPPARPVTVGTVSSLVLKVTPNPGIHVYAPGNPDYIPVAVDIAAPAGVKVEAAVFPQGQVLFFGPQKTAVKVYSEPFDVKVPFTPQGSLRKAHPSGKTTVVTLHGNLSYQACNERVCFPPQSAPFDAQVTVDLKAAR